MNKATTTRRRNLIEIHGGKGKSKTGENNDIQYCLTKKDMKPTEHPFGEPAPLLQLHLSSCTPSMSIASF
jgi:hypothetical protein